MTNHYLAMGHLQLMFREQIAILVTNLNDPQIITYPGRQYFDRELFASSLVITDGHANVGIHPKPEKSDWLLGIHNIRLRYFSSHPDKVSQADQLSQLIRNHFAQLVGSPIEGEFGSLEFQNSRDPAHDVRNCFWSLNVAYIFAPN